MAIEVHNPNTGAVIELTEEEFQQVIYGVRAIRRYWIGSTTDHNRSVTEDVVRQLTRIDALLSIVKD